MTPRAGCGHVPRQIQIDFFSPRRFVAGGGEWHRCGIVNRHPVPVGRHPPRAPRAARRRRTAGGVPGVPRRPAPLLRARRLGRARLRPVLHRALAREPVRLPVRRVRRRPPGARPPPGPVLHARRQNARRPPSLCGGPGGAGAILPRDRPRPRLPGGARAAGRAGRPGLLRTHVRQPGPAALRMGAALARRLALGPAEAADRGCRRERPSPPAVFRSLAAGPPVRQAYDRAGRHP